MKIDIDIETSEVDIELNAMINKLIEDKHKFHKLVVDIKHDPKYNNCDREGYHPYKDEDDYE